MIVIVYHLLIDPDATFQELGGDYFHKRNQEQGISDATCGPRNLSVLVSAYTDCGLGGSRLSIEAFTLRVDLLSRLPLNFLLPIFVWQLLYFSGQRLEWYHRWR